SASVNGRDIDGHKLTDNILQHDMRDFSILAYGLSGAGKDMLGLYLADKMGIEANIVRASDWLDAYRGETEAKMKACFAMAREQRSMIIITEGDTFVRPRSSMEKSWEVSTVNELLTQLNDHPQPVVLTTNSELRDIDAAFMRRFTW